MPFNKKVTLILGIVIRHQSIPIEVFNFFIISLLASYYKKNMRSCFLFPMAILKINLSTCTFINNKVQC